MNVRSNPSTGFTLIEVIVAIAIPRYSAYRDKAMTAQALSELSDIRLSIE